MDRNLYWNRKQKFFDTRTVLVRNLIFFYTIWQLLSTNFLLASAQTTNIFQDNSNQRQNTFENEKYAKPNIEINLERNLGWSSQSLQISSIFKQIRLAIEFEENNTSLSNGEYLNITDFTTFWYSACINVGTYSANSKEENKKFCVVLDTGLSDFQVLDSSGTFQEKYVNRTINHLYDSSASLTSKIDKDSKSVSLNSLKGEINGITLRDQVKIDKLTVNNQGFISVKYISGIYMYNKHKAYDGVQGMAFKSLSKSGFIPLMDNIFEQYSSQIRRFTFDFVTDIKKPRLIIGYSKFENKNHKITKAPIIKNGQKYSRQIIQSNSIKIGTQSKINYCPNCHVVLDTGSPYFGIPKKQYDAFIKYILFRNSNPYEHYDCKNFAYQGQFCQKSHINSMPNLMIEIRKNKFIFEPKDYCTVFKYKNKEYILPKFDKLDKEYQVLGLPQFEKVYTSLDYTDKNNPYALFSNIRPVSYHKKLSTLSIFFIALIISVIGLGLIALAIFQFRRYRNNRSQNLEYDETHGYQSINE